MTQVETVYEYLKRNYPENEPIFLSELSIPGMKNVSVRLQLKKLIEDAKIRRYDTGIYYLPGQSMFRSGSAPSADLIIRRKYLMNGTEQCGYISGIFFANRLGITTQIPMAYELSTNKATTDYREVRLAGLRVILRRPCVEVNAENAAALQFLDLMKDVADISEVRGQELTDRLLAYMEKMKLKFDSLKPYFQYYPERIYKNMYEAGLLDGVSA